MEEDFFKILSCFVKRMCREAKEMKLTLFMFDLVWNGRDFKINLLSLPLCSRVELSNLNNVTLISVLYPLSGCSLLRKVSFF